MPRGRVCGGLDIWNAVSLIDKIGLQPLCYLLKMLFIWQQIVFSVFLFSCFSTRTFSSLPFCRLCCSASFRLDAIATHWQPSGWQPPRCFSTDGGFCAM